MIRRAVLLLAPMVVMIWAAHPAQAQNRAGHNGAARIPVTIVMVDGALPSGQTWVVQRMPDHTPADRILIDSHADAEQLAEAVRALLVVRQADGDIPLRRMTLRLRPEQTGRGRRLPLPWTPRVWADLQRAGVSEIPGLGNARSLQIWLPRQQRGPAARPRTSS